MSLMNVVKVDALPVTPDPNTVYLVRHTGVFFPNTFLTIVTDSNGVPYENLSIHDYKRQHFNLKIENVSGTIKHSIYSTVDKTKDSKFASCVNNHSHVPSITPTGPDASTDFTAGVKISSVDDSVIILHTKDIVSDTDAFTTTLTDAINVGNNVTIGVDTSLRNVNGVSRHYLALKLNASAAALFDTDGDYVVINIFGHANPY